MLKAEAIVRIRQHRQGTRQSRGRGQRRLVGDGLSAILGDHQPQHGIGLGIVGRDKRGQSQGPLVQRTVQQLGERLLTMGGIARVVDALGQRVRHPQHFIELSKHDDADVIGQMVGEGTQVDRPVVARRANQVSFITHSVSSWRGLTV